MPKTHWMDVIDRLEAEKAALEIANDTLKARVAELEAKLAPSAVVEAKARHGWYGRSWD